MKMVRKQVYLTEAQDEMVKRLAQSRGVAEAEIIRDALDGLVEYRLADGQGGRRVRETATLEYGASIMEAERKTTNALSGGLDREAGLRQLERMKERARELATSESSGRTWTREDLYDERPKYLSR
jgi:hypothetical protein